jgi:excisionase family DNA binding protein
MENTKTVTTEDGAAAQFMTVKHAAQVLAMPESSLYRNLQLGRIPGRRVGRYVRIPRDWVEAPTDRKPGDAPSAG